MNIQEMLGDSFHEGMSIEEINTALSGKKFADLSTGNYVDRNKYNADIAAKDNALQKANEALNAQKSTVAKADSQNDSNIARIQELEEIIKNQTISSNRDKAESLTNDLRNILDIKSDDSDYTNLLDSLSKSETETARSIASYVNKIAKDSYEKGKKDATKDNLGNFSNGVGKQGSPKQEEIGKFGKELAQSLQPSVDPNLYFKRN